MTLLHKPVSNSNISGINAEKNNQTTANAVRFVRFSLTVLGIFLAGHGDHLSQGDDQADGNPRAQRGVHVWMPDRQRPHKSERARPRATASRLKKSKYPWVEQAPGWTITANWNKLPSTSLPASLSLLLLLNHLFFFFLALFQGQPPPRGSCNCLERCS